MQQLYEVRKEHGGVFITVFNDGFLIPWKPLSMGDYIKYSQDRQRGVILPARLEDEIFSKCVQDKSILRQMPFLNAGIISTVVVNIWQFSGPTGIEEFNDDIEAARQIMSADGVNVLHELVQIITTAFPYKPEEVYAMDYQTFLFRVAQSEKKLLQLGIFLKEPILLQREDKQKGKRRNKLGTIDQAQKPNISGKDVINLWNKQQNITSKQPESPKPNPGDHHLKLEDIKTEEKWWKISPALEATNNHGIDFKQESAEQRVFGLTGHEKQDAHLEQASIIKDAYWIYADLIAELEKRKKTK